MFKILRTSVRAKISAIVATAVIGAVILGAGASAIREAEKRFTSKRAELEGIATALAAATSRSLASDNRMEIGRTLSAIGRIPGIAFAQVFDRGWNAVFELGNSVVVENGGSRVVPNGSLHLWSDLSLEYYVLEKPILHDGTRIGTLRIIADISELKNAIWESIVEASLVGLLAAMFGVLLSSRLQRAVTEPISVLTLAMENVRTTHDFSRPVEKTSEDETGRMVETFNDMLLQIRDRDMHLAQHRDRLEAEVEARTADLRQATIEAQRANAAKSEFLATMSHEIRTPLNGMLVMAELLSVGDLPSKLQRHAEVIVSSGKTLLAIINDILDLSKIEAGRLELEMVPVELTGVADHVMNLFSAKAESNNIDLACYVSPHVPQRVYADPVRLNQILANLVNNALKFTEQGSVMLEIGLADECLGDAKTCRLHFSVKDTGIGIPEDKLQVIFERFSQADQSTTRKYGGTGIGLSISRELVSAMGGNLGVTSAIGEGSNFHFTIECEVVDPPAQISPPNPAPLALLAMPPSITRDVIVKLLKDRGWNPLLADEAQTYDPFSQPIKAVIADPSQIATAITHLDIKVSGVSKKCHMPLRAVVAGIGDAGALKALDYGLADELLSRPVSATQMAAFLDASISGMKPTKLHATVRSETEGRSKRFMGMRVLAADDTAVNREVLAEALERLGIRVTLVSDGEEAVEALRDATFDLVFMDCSMPVLDGYAATREIRKLEKAQGRAPAPIVALTAHVAGATATSWRDAGMSDYITKPFTLKTIAATLDKWLVPSEEIHVHAVTSTAGESLVENDLERQAPVLDFTVLDDLRETGGPAGDLVERILALYKCHAPQTLAKLQEAVASGEPERIAETAHALKSMCRNIGAERLSEVLQRIEWDARSGLSDLARAEIARLPHELSQVLKTLDSLAVRESDKSPPTALQA
jgi:two-component system sensor histidine kinase BarA